MAPAFAFAARHSRQRLEPSLTLNLAKAEPCKPKKILPTAYLVYAIQRDDLVDRRLRPPIPGMEGTFDVHPLLGPFEPFC
jgi:hypothetical protein